MNIYQKIDLVCERLDGYMLHNPDSAKLSYSGGRDSHLILHIARNVLKYDNNKFPAVYAKTYNEFAEIRHRIEAQDITVIDSGRKIFDIFKTEGLPLWSKDCSTNIEYATDKKRCEWQQKKGTQWDYTAQYNWAKENDIKCSSKCCLYLKEKLLKKANIVGLRKAEGGRRATGKNKEYNFCVLNSKVLFKPIFDVADCELSEMEKVLGIKPLNIYNYLKRTGCVMCGFGTKQQIKDKINYLRWYEPQRARFYIKYFEPYLKYRKII